MATYRVHKTKDYTVMSNTHLRDKGLSLKGKGLLSLMLSLPESWDYTIAGLVAISKENETAIKSTLDELKSCGYLVVTKLTPSQTQSGRFEYQYDIYEQPQQKQKLEKQGKEKQDLESLGLENQGQLNTNSLNTKKSITNNQIEYIVEYLNSKAGTSYKAKTKATKQHINARLAEGFSVDDCKRVIDNMTAEWLHTEWEQYLRPSTLFGTKFENYLNRKPSQRKGKNGVNLSSQPSELDGLF